MKDFKTYGKAKILLIESNEETASILVGIIASKFNVTCIADEDIAINLLQSEANVFSTVIVEVKTALSFIKKIRTIHSLDNLPVIISSSSSELEDELLDLNVIYFLKKPYNEARILNKIRNSVKIFEASKAIDDLERDELTGLYTRRAFLHRAEMIRSGNPEKNYCVIAFDFDNFKSTNTLYGEKKCNEFLSYTAHKLMDKVPYGISGRFGGDQYVLFFEYEDKVDLDILKKIQRYILDTAPVPHQIVKTGIYAPIDSESSMVLCCDRAFFAIRDIKGIYGKDIAFFENKLLQQLLDEQHIIDTMERGLNNGEFKVFYQPKHEAITGQIAGAEALVRWEHPEYGFLMPHQFIPLFERNGFISTLDLFILEQVCKDITRWQTNGFPVVPVSVNISRHDLLEPGCLEKQLNLIDSYKIPHNLLHMEVTESLYSDKTDLIISKVRKTQDLGFMIEMDDFGSGYSSLGMLSSFPLNILKLDISFVKNIKSNEIVIESIIKMAHKMGLTTVAEGAESNEQYIILRSLGCDFIQGFYFSKPLPLPNFEDYLVKTTVYQVEQSSSKKLQTEKNVTFNESVLLAANEVAESLPSGFFSCHADGDFEIIAFNTELVKMYGCSTAAEFREFTGNVFRNLVLKDDLERVLNEVSTQITSDEIRYIDFRIKTKDNKIKFLRTFGRFVHTEKYGDIFYVFANDSTEERKRKFSEAIDKFEKNKLKQSAESAENANKAKNIFMYNVAKNILTPMQSIIKYTNLMKENISDEAVLKQMIAKAKESEEIVLSFINNIIELSLIENGETTVTETATDLTNATDRIYTLIKEAAEQKNIKVEYWSEIPNPYIYQDIFHTTDVVMNIITNAIKYTMPGGKIRFGIKQTPGKNDDECTVDFICEDSGIGISKEFLPKIFDSFSKEDNQVNAESPSAGLGLLIAKKLITLMNGTIEITSTQGKGTTVRTSQPHRYAKKEDVETSTTLSDHL